MSYAKVELKQVGQSMTIAVQRCAKATVGRYPGIEFYGIDQSDGRPVILEVPQSSTDRQLARHGLSYDKTVGKNLTFSRAASGDPAKPYWNIDVSGQTSAARTPSPQPAPELGHIPGLDDIPEPVPPEDATVSTRAEQKFASLLIIHEACFLHAVKLCAASEIPPTLEGISALTAQVFIQACK